MVTGDFNVPRDSAAFERFTVTTGLRDLLAGDREPTYRPPSGGRIPPHWTRYCCAHRPA
ncbi:hypothetical protein [Streptomyces tateyamensis]|uniref:hypothetical protein n=1 Tax=Streptomyces tateyamensis TaxID=565073 RepID=UPI0015E89242|nr:hypothetical protein [Streptomyces tateyamensis]